MSDITFAILLLFTTSILACYIWSIIWGYKDATRRHKSGLLVALLIAFFAWPFGLLFWSIMRPEKIAKTVKSNNLSEANQYLVSFRQMPWLLKLLLIATLYSLLLGVKDFVGMKIVEFRMFDIDFPTQLSPLWHIYSILVSVYTTLVFFSRSYTTLKLYVYFSLLSIVVPTLNIIYSLASLPSGQIAPTIFEWLFTYGLVSLVLVYLLKQKKYFSRL